MLVWIHRLISKFIIIQRREESSNHPQSSPNIDKTILEGRKDKRKCIDLLTNVVYAPIYVQTMQVSSQFAGESVQISLLRIHISPFPLSKIRKGGFYKLWHFPRETYLQICIIYSSSLYSSICALKNKVNKGLHLSRTSKQT